MATPNKIQNIAVTFCCDSVMHTAKGKNKVKTKEHDGLRPASEAFSTMITDFFYSGGHITSSDQVPKGSRHLYIDRVEKLLKRLNTHGKAHVLPQGGSDIVLGKIHIPYLENLLEWLMKAEAEAEAESERVENRLKRKFKSVTNDSVEIDMIQVIATYSSGPQNIFNIPVIIDDLSLTLGRGRKYGPGQPVEPQTLLMRVLAFLPELPNPNTLTKLSTCLYITSINCDRCGETCCEQCDERGQKILDLWKYIARPDQDSMLAALWGKSTMAKQEGATMPEFPSWDGKFFFNSAINPDVETERDAVTLREFCAELAYH